MIARNLLRHHWRSLLSVVGIALSGALLVLASYMFSAFDDMLDRHYGEGLRMDLTIHLAEPVNDRELATFRQLPGMLYSEGFRQVPVQVSRDRRSQRALLTGMPADSALRVLRQDSASDALSYGVLMTDFLASQMRIAPGDTFTLTLLSDSQRTVELTLAGLVNEPLGLGIYMQRHALNRLIGEGYAINGIWALHDPDQQVALFDALNAMPQVMGIGQIRESERDIRQYIDDTVLAAMAVMLVLAGSITFAVVYNNARVIFAERERELATLRVLGYTRLEVAWLLVGEITVLVLLAIPLAWLIGSGFVWILIDGLSNEMFRVPFIVTTTPFAYAAGGILVATALSLALVVRRLYRLNILAAYTNAAGS